MLHTYTNSGKFVRNFIPGVTVKYDQLEENSIEIYILWDCIILRYDYKIFTLSSINVHILNLIYLTLWRYLKETFRRQTQTVNCYVKLVTRKVYRIV